MRGKESLKKFLAPNQGSSPTLTFFPSPIFQTTQSPTRGKASTRAFHTMDPFEDLFGCLSHSVTKRLGKYLDHITLIQSEFPTNSLQRFLPAKALAKRQISLIPQPPKALGIAEGGPLC
jgi:hypothetical protein